MRKPARPTVLVLAPALLAGLLILAAGACDGGANEGPGSTDADYDGYARTVCLARDRVVDAVLGRTAPGTAPSRDVMIAAWEGFVTDLSRAEPPGEMRDWHSDWVKMSRNDLELLRQGKPKYYDPFDHAPELGPALAARWAAAESRVAECLAPTPAPVESAAPPPSPTAPSAAARIDYGQPEKYLEPGAQSRLTAENASAVRAELPDRPAGLEMAGAIAAWVRAAFRVVPSRGATVGATDVNTLLSTRVVTGCHDSALLLATVLRAYAIPAVMVDTAGIGWAEQQRAGTARGFSGHVFVEAYAGGRWVLIECGSGTFVSKYDPANPAINCPALPDPRGYYVLARGLDPAGYGVTGIDALNRLMLQFANELPTLDTTTPGYEWQPLP